MKLPKVVIAVGVAILLSVLLTAQDRPGFRSNESAPPAPGLARQPDLTEGVTLTMCTTDLRKTLVHDASGRLVADARSLTLDMPRFGEQPTCTCKMYLGVYEPTGATKKVWPVREIKLVDEADFQKLVDIGATPLRLTPNEGPEDAFAPQPPAAANTPEKKVDRTGTIPLSGGTPKN